MADNPWKTASDGEAPAATDAEGSSAPSRARGVRLPWIRLAAELAVIFLGVTLGLLADDWRQSRDDRQAERQALGELLADLEADSVGLGLLRQALVVDDRSAMWLRNNLGQPGTDPDSAVGPLTSIYIFQTYQAPRATYAGLRSSGQLVLIRDDGLRRAVTRYYEERQPYVMGFYEAYSDFWLPFRKAASRDWILDYAPESSTYSFIDPGAEPPRLRRLTPWQQLPSDPYFMYYLDELGVLSSVSATRIGEVLVENAEIRGAIRDHLAR